MTTNYTQNIENPIDTGRLPKTILARMFSQVSIGHLRFIIMDCPTDSTLNDYLKELKMRGVTDVVRLCEPTYDHNILTSQGISVHDWAFPDGGVPPTQVLNNFHTLCETRFTNVTLSKDVIAERKITIVEQPSVIAVHCVAGLGRAPVLVATCLIDAGFTPTDAIDFIRKCRRGAFNATQLKYLIDDYKRKSRSPFSFLKRSSNASAKEVEKRMTQSISSEQKAGFLSKVFNFKKTSNSNISSN